MKDLKPKGIQNNNSTEMTSPKRHTEPLDEIQALTQAFSKAEPGPFLEAKIMRAIESEMHAGNTRTWGWLPLGLRVGGIAALLVLNIFTYLYLRQGGETTTEQETLAQTYWSHEELIIQ